MCRAFPVWETGKMGKRARGKVHICTAGMVISMLLGTSTLMMTGILLSTGYGQRLYTNWSKVLILATVCW